MSLYPIGAVIFLALTPHRFPLRAKFFLFSQRHRGSDSRPRLRSGVHHGAERSAQSPRNAHLWTLQGIIDSVTGKLLTPPKTLKRR